MLEGFLYLLRVPLDPYRFLLGVPGVRSIGLFFGVLVVFVALLCDAVCVSFGGWGGSCGISFVKQSEKETL